MMDMQELVVPRSIPRIFDMGVVLVAIVPFAGVVPFWEDGVKCFYFKGFGRLRGDRGGWGRRTVAQLGGTF